MTIPAFGHYQTLKGIVLALAARGHNVTLLGCEATGKDMAADSLLGVLGAHGGRVSFLSLGACPSYAGREAALGALIAGAPGGVARVLEGIRELSQDMCRSAMAYYAADPRGRLPGALVFDADTYCAMDVSVRWRVPRVARVGTGLRDAFTTPLSVPAFSTGLPLAMDLSQRLTNWATLLASRALIAPLLLPWLYSGHRAEWLLLGGGEGGVARHRPTSPLGVALNEASMAPNLLWDGVPTLYNSHWGLEHARPLAPYEHLIGHTNDFLGDASRPLEGALGSWLSHWGGGTENGTSASAEAVVYVGMGTLGVLPRASVSRLAGALGACPRARFVWSVPLSQQGLLPEALTQASEAAHCYFGGREAGCAAEGGDRARVLLVPWAPQQAILVHPSVAAFVTHGGMNGMAEGLFARLPLLCVPLFADQPDNCAHAVDKGYAARLSLAELTEEAFCGALGGLLEGQEVPRIRAALQDAWVRNVAAGGAARAVAIVEAAAALPYGSHLGEVPREFFLPWYQRTGADVGIVVLLVLLAALGSCVQCYRRLCQGCCRGSEAMGKVKGL
jgi:UDP:flavonoid glycosyltransferase YjiC (YdhE family)